MTTESLTNKIKADILENILSVENELDFNDENNKIVKVINGAYDIVKKKTLQEYPWSFAGRFKKLEQTEDNQDARYKYCYTLPTDFLHTRGEFRSASENNPIHDKVIYPHGIFTNESVLYLFYTSNVDESLLPDYFLEYFMFSVAERICLSVTGDYNLLEVLAEKVRKERRASKQIDSRRAKTRRINTSGFLF